MDAIEDILEYNSRFVETSSFEPYSCDKYPRKRLAIIACMDTRLTQLLPAALGLANGDAVLIKNAGALSTNPFGSVIRSLLVAILELKVDHIMVIGHTDCGAQNMDPDKMCAELVASGVPQASIDLMRYCGVDFDRWLSGFESPEASVRGTVTAIRDHPLVPASVSTRGFVMDSVTGALVEVEMSG